MSTDPSYRPCVGVVLANEAGLIFTGERIDTPGAWQMPQGGIDDGEEPIQAAYRELKEETGVPPELVTLETALEDWVYYDFPKELSTKLWKGRFRGQKQRWFLFRFAGCDDQISLTEHDQEFAKWRWSTPDEVLADIVPFKRDVYARVIEGIKYHL